jgi:hypothetical protein
MAENNNATFEGSNGTGGVQPTQVTGTNNQSGQNNTQTDGANTAKTYTEAEFISEVDRRVSQAQAKWAAELDKKLNTARSEGEKLAKMSADERAKAEFETDKKEFESERAKYEAERLEFEAVKQLSENKLPVSFAKMCVGKDAEETKTNIEAFKTAWGEALQSAVNDRMRGTTPKAGNGENTNVSSGFVDVINELHR